MLFTLLIGCTSTTKPTIEGDYGLLSVQDAKDLKRLIATNNDNSFFSGIGGLFRSDKAVTEAPEMDSTDNSQGSTDYTKTNVQVEGVDEGDIVKTDGRRIYSIQHNALRVVNLLGQGEMECVLYEELQSFSDTEHDEYYDYYYWDYTYFSDLYLTDKYLVVLGTRYQNTYYVVSGDIGIDDSEGVSIEPKQDAYRSWFVSTTIIRIYDIETLEIKDEYEISGYLQTSRLIENRLYVINQHYLYSFDEEYDVRPWIKHQDEVDYVAYSDIKYLEDQEYRSFTMISSIILENEITYECDVFLGAQSWGQIYINQNAIYFGSTYYWWNFWGTTQQKGTLISYLIHPETGRIHFGGAGKFQGYILNQFAMDEYDGYMRIVTTEGWGSSAKNRLYVYQRKLTNGVHSLEIVGLIDEGLGKPNETVHSVRFQGDKATVVTFEQIDPLYTIDLSDPRNPQIKGALEVTGVSLYQEPWGDHYVIGIGFDEVTQFGRGMKLSLFDISDFDNPVEVGQPHIITSSERTWVYSEALYNHKSILVDESYGFLGFSLWRYGWTNFYYTSMNDYLIFDVDVTREKPIQPRFTFSHIDYFDAYRTEYPNYWQYSFAIDRVVRVDDYFYAISGEVITSHHLSGEPMTKASVVFKLQTK